MFGKSIIRDSNRDLYPLITTVIGSLAFILVEEALKLLIPHGTKISDHELLFWFIAVPVATVIMFTVLGMIKKYKLILLLIVSEVGYCASLYVGFFIGELSNHRFDSFAFLGYLLFAIVFGIFIGVFFFGKEAILFFMVVCGLAAIPCALLFDITVVEHFPLSILYGTSVGLSVGLYKRRNKKTMTIAAIFIVITTIAIALLSCYQILDVEDIHVRNSRDIGYRTKLDSEDF